MCPTPLPCQKNKNKTRSAPPRGLYTKQGHLKSLASCKDFPNNPQPFWTDFFTQAVEDTESPALAVQALNTAVARMLYTRWLPSFTYSKPANVTSLVKSRAPTRAVGYTLVLAIILVQIVLLVIAATMFRRCQSSMLDNVWMTTAQVAASPEVGDVLARAGTMSDAEVTRHVRGERGIRMLKWKDDPVRLVVRDGMFRPVDEYGMKRSAWSGAVGNWRRVYGRIPEQRKRQKREVSPSGSEEN